MGTTDHRRGTVMPCLYGQISPSDDRSSAHKKAMSIALPIQMRYKIVSRDVGARHCRALTDVPH